MQNIPAAQMWHLSRGMQQRFVISDQELRLLAQRGRLRADDLVWKRGYDGWRTAFSVPGLLTPPRCRNPISEINQADKIHMHAEELETPVNFATKLHNVRMLSASLVATVTGCFSLARKSFRWLRRQTVVGHKISLLAVRAAAGSETFLSRLEHPRVLACLLAAAVGVGTLDIAMQSSFANSAGAVRKYQDRPLERAAASASVSTIKWGWPLFPEKAGSDTLVEYAFSGFQPATSKDRLKALSEASQYNRAQLLPLLKKRWNLKRYPCLLESQKRRPLVQTILTANALTSHQSDCLRLELEELVNRSR